MGDHNTQLAETCQVDAIRILLGAEEEKEIGLLSKPGEQGVVVRARDGV